MTGRPSRQTVAALAVLCVVTLLCFSQQSVGQVPADSTGSYQMMVSDSEKVYILDVNTGECWVKKYLTHTDTKWRALGSPVSKQAAEQAPDVDVRPPVELESKKRISD